MLLYKSLCWDSNDIMREENVMDADGELSQSDVILFRMLYGDESVKKEMR